MLETYFVKPETAGRIRACWIGAEIESYAGWLAEQGYRTRTVRRHVQALVAFGEFARRRGASALADLPAHVDDFVAIPVAAYRRGRDAATEVRSPVEQMLTVILPGFERTGRTHRELPFARSVPGFFEYLAAERGLRPESIVSCRHHLACFEAYLDRIGAAGLAELSPAILSAFVAERSGAGLARTTMRSGCGVLRVFLRYAHRQGLLAADLSKVVEWPTAYQLSGIPRSISWAEAGRVLGCVDRRTACGKRDYAILLLLVTYGLRAREVAALTLDDIDWRRDRLAVPGRKAGHSTAFPLSAVVGEALVDCLRHGRPPSSDRHVFSGLWPRRARPAGSRSPRAPSTTWSRRGSRCLGRGRTRCGIPASSGGWFNRDVPQEVVRVLLDHSSTQMTAHYAKLTDQTVRRRWEQAARVNISGERVTIDPDGPLGQAQWAKTRYGIATQTLPNGYCGLPVQRQCPHANSCLTCPVFITGPEFLPELREQQQRTLTLITTARDNGHLRVTEMNEQVAANLDRMITELEAIGPDEQKDAADAG